MKLRKRARKLLRRMAGRPDEKSAAAKPAKAPFPGSRRYWEDRYAGGGDSGAGSYSKFADFKAEVLNTFVAENQISTVLEFGCGDGNQLMLANYLNYLGLDVSATAIEACRSKFAGDDSKSFKLLERYAGETADLVLSLDVIYHLVEDDEYQKHMTTIFAAATRYVIIYSSNTDENQQRHRHIRHRKFADWIDANGAGWSLARHIPNKYPCMGDHLQGSFADFYIYEKRAGNGPAHRPAARLANAAP